eukprot:5247233-Pleurochrysis_carterae.AAC.2
MAQSASGDGNAHRATHSYTPPNLANVSSEHAGAEVGAVGEPGPSRWQSQPRYGAESAGAEKAAGGTWLSWLWPREPTVRLGEGSTAKPGSSADAQGRAAHRDVP